MSQHDPPRTYLHDAADRLAAFIRTEELAPTVIPSLRITIAFVAPIIVGPLIGRPDVSLWAGIASLNLAQADTGGPYPQRAVTLIGGTALVAAATFFGALAGAQLWSATLFMGLVAVGAGFARSLGQRGFTLGNATALLFLFSLVYAVPVPDAALRGVEVVGAGLWVITLSLFLWPFYPNRPLYLAVANAWEATANLLHTVNAEGPSAASAEEREAQISAKVAALRTALNGAVSSLGSNRAAAQGSNPVGEALLVLTRGASRLGAAVFALKAALEAIRGKDDYTRERQQIEAVMASCEETIRAIATLLASRMIGEESEAIGQRIRSIEQMIDDLDLPDTNPEMLTSEQILVVRVVAVLQEISDFLRAAMDTLEQLSHAQKRWRSARLAPANLLQGARQGMNTLRQELSFDSLIFRHALRVGLASAVGIIIFQTTSVPRGYWIVLTVLVVLQPDFGGTLQRSWQRIFGTLVGGAIGSVILIFTPSYAVLIPALALGCFGFMLLRTRHYGVAVIFLTVMVVLLFDALRPSTWVIAVYRLLSTAIGGALAVMLGYAFWPSWERRRFPAHMARAIRANRDYLQVVLDAIGSHSGFEQPIIQARKTAEIENGNASASYQRMLADPARQRRNVELGNALVTFTNRLTRQITALAVYLPGLSEQLSLPERETFTNQIAGALDAVAEAIEQDAPPGALPPFGETLSQIKDRLHQLRKMVSRAPAKAAAGLVSPELLDYTLVWSQLDKIAREVTGMQLALRQARTPGADAPDSANPSAPALAASRGSSP